MRSIQSRYILRRTLTHGRVTAEAIRLRWGSARGILINVQPFHIVKFFFLLLTIVNS